MISHPTPFFFLSSLKTGNQSLCHLGVLRSLCYLLLKVYITKNVHIAMNKHHHKCFQMELEIVVFYIEYTVAQKLDTGFSSFLQKYEIPAPSHRTHTTISSVRELSFSLLNRQKMLECLLASKNLRQTPFFTIVMYFCVSCPILLHTMVHVTRF